MQLYAILRRDGFVTVRRGPAGGSRTLDQGRQRGHARPGALDPQLRAVSEPSGKLGTFCIYEASSPEAIREHAERARLPVDEIVEIADTVVVRPDPQRPR